MKHESQLVSVWALKYAMAWHESNFRWIEKQTAGRRYDILSKFGFPFGEHYDDASHDHKIYLSVLISYFADRRIILKGCIWNVALFLECNDDEHHHVSILNNNLSIILRPFVGSSGSCHPEFGHRYSIEHFHEGALNSDSSPLVVYYKDERGQSVYGWIATYCALNSHSVPLNCSQSTQISCPKLVFSFV